MPRKLFVNKATERRWVVLGRGLLCAVALEPV